MTISTCTHTPRFAQLGPSHAPPRLPLLVRVSMVHPMVPLLVTMLLLLPYGCWSAPNGFCDSSQGVYCGSVDARTGNCTNAFDCNCLSGYDHGSVYPGTCIVSTEDECSSPGPLSIDETSLGTTAALGFNPVPGSVELTKAGSNVALSVTSEAVASRSGFDLSWSSSLLSADRPACDAHAMSAFLSGTTQTLTLGCDGHATQAVCDASAGCAWNADLGACATAYRYHKYTTSNVSQVAYSCDADTGPVLSDDVDAGQTAILVSGGQEGNPSPPGRHFVCDGATATASNRLYCPSPNACPLTQKVSAPTGPSWRWTCPEQPVCPPPPMPGYTSPWSLDTATTFTFYECPTSGITFNPAVYSPDHPEPCSQAIACAPGATCPEGWFCQTAGPEAPQCPPLGTAWLIASKKKKNAAEEADSTVTVKGARVDSEVLYYCPAGVKMIVGDVSLYDNIDSVMGTDGAYECRGDDEQGEWECASPYSCPVHVAADGTRTHLTCVAPSSDSSDEVSEEVGPVAGSTFNLQVVPIFGTANGHEEWTAVAANGIVVAMKAHTRYQQTSPCNADIASPQIAPGIYQFPYQNPHTDHNPCAPYACACSSGVNPDNAPWNFDWSVNVEGTGLRLADFTYELGLDQDGSEGTTFLSFDPITIPNPLNIRPDNHYGTSDSDEGDDVSFSPPVFNPDAGQVDAYNAVLETHTIAQNSWNYGTFAALSFGEPWPNEEGRYEYYLAVKDAAGDELARVQISVFASAVADGETDPSVLTARKRRAAEPLELCPPRSGELASVSKQLAVADLQVTAANLDAAPTPVNMPFAFGGYPSSDDVSLTCAAACGGTCPFATSGALFVTSGARSKWTAEGTRMGPHVLVFHDAGAGSDGIVVLLDAQLSVLAAYDVAAARLADTYTTAELAQLRADGADAAVAEVALRCEAGSFDTVTRDLQLDQCSLGSAGTCHGLHLASFDDSVFTARYRYTLDGAVTTCDAACSGGDCGALAEDGQQLYCRGRLAPDVASSTEPTIRVTCAPSEFDVLNPFLMFEVDDTGAVTPLTSAWGTVSAVAWDAVAGTLTVTVDTCGGVPITLQASLQQSRGAAARAFHARRRQQQQHGRRDDGPAVYTCANAPASSLLQSAALNAYVDTVWGPGLADPPAVGLYFPPPVAGTRDTYEAPVSPRQFAADVDDRTGTSLALQVYPCSRGPVYCLGGSADGWHLDAVTDQDALVCPPATADVSGVALVTVAPPAVGEPHTGWQRQSTCWDRIDVDVPFAGAVARDCCRRDEVDCSNNGASARCARYSCAPRVCAVDALPEAEGTGLSTTRSVCQDLPLQVLYTISFSDASLTFSAEVDGTAECFLVQMLFDDVEQRFAVVTECRVANPFRMSEPFTQVSSADGTESTKLPQQLPQGKPDSVAPAGTFTHGHTNTFGNALPAYDTPARAAGTTTYSYTTSNCPTELTSAPEDRCIHTTTVFFNRPPAGWGVHCTTNTFDGSSNAVNPWVLTWGGDFVCKDTQSVPSASTPCGGITSQPAAAQLQVSAVNVDFCAEVFQVQFTVDLSLHDVVTGAQMQGDLSQNTDYLVRARVVPLAGQEEATTFVTTSNVTRVVLEGDIVGGAPGYEIVLMDVNALTQPGPPVSTSVANFGSRVQQELVNDVVTSVLYLEFELSVTSSTFFVSTSQPGPGIAYRLLVSGNVDHVGSNAASKRITFASARQNGDKRRADVVVDPFFEAEGVTATVTSASTDGSGTSGGGGLANNGSGGGLSGVVIGLIVAAVVVSAVAASVVVIVLRRRKHSLPASWEKGRVKI